MKITGNSLHTFVCSDTDARKLVWINETGNIIKEISVLDCVFDIWILPDGRVLYPFYGGEHGSGIRIVDDNGVTCFEYKTEKEVFCCQPLENGNILVAELGTKRLIEVNQNGIITVDIPIPYEGNPHECMRMARKHGEYYYVVQPGINLIRKLSLNGQCIKEYNIHRDAFGLVIRPNGNLVYTCMSGAYELDESGNEIWSLTHTDVPEMNICWLLGIQLLTNGNLVLTNWMGHGHMDEGIHFFEVTREKEVVWFCDSRKTLMQPATLQILEEDAKMVCYRPMR